MRWKYSVFTVAALFTDSGFGDATGLPVGETRLSGTLFLDSTWLRKKSSGMPGNSDINVDLKRFFFDIDHRFSEIWSAQITTDIQWMRHDYPDPWLRHAYVQGNFSQAFIMQLGAAPTPWRVYVNKWSGYRYVERDLTTRARIGSGSDWGGHISGSFDTAGHIRYAAAVMTGASYQKLRVGDIPDVSVRISWEPNENSTISLGSYRGRFAQDYGIREALHTAQSWSLMAAWADERWRFGGQYFYARNLYRILQPDSDRSYGWSSWASMQLTPAVAILARHDKLKPSTWLNPYQQDRYSHIGLEWKINSSLRMAAIWKHGRIRNTNQQWQTNDEAGVWARIHF